MRHAIAVAACCASGFAGLVYEVVWIRRATLVFGSTTFAVSTVLAVFFLGLALGSFAFGRIATRVARPLRLLVWMELGVAALAWASPPAFDAVDAVYGSAVRALGEQLPALFAIRIGLIAAILLPPSVLMGGTLPVFCHYYIVARDSMGAVAGWLYSLNTLGAALGCAATGLWLIPRLGMRGSIAFGVGLDVVVAIGLAGVGWNARALRAAAPAEPADLPTPARPALVLALVFAIGAITLANEVLWTRFFALVVHNSVHTYTLTLSVVLVGIVIGSALAGRIADAGTSRALAFGALQLTTALCVASVMLLPPGLWNALSGERVGVYAAALLPPSILSGAAFPLGVRMLVSDAARASRGVGRLLAANTAGGVAGSLAAGFVTLPVLGMHSTLRLTTGASLLVAAIAWFGIERGRPPVARVIGFTAAACLWLALPSLLQTRLPADYLSGGGELVAFREGRAANVAVIRRPGILELEIDRHWQGQDYKSHQALVAHVPMLLHPRPRRVAVVGIGAGQTPSRFLMYEIEQLDCIDIEPAVFEMIRAHFDSAWMDDPRVRLIRDDGRSHLAHSSEQYDVISLELGQIGRPGVPFFYTADFYERLAARLAPGGLVTQFVPVEAFAPDQFRAVVATFIRSFPQSVLWYNTSELLLIGSQSDRFEIPIGRLELLERPGPVRRDLDHSHWGDPTLPLHDRRVFLASLLLGPDELADLARDAVLYRDDRPILDYSVAGVSFAQLIRHPTLDALESRLTPLKRWLPAFSDAELSEIASIRGLDLGDIRVAAAVSRAAGLAQHDAYAAMLRTLEPVIHYNPRNFLARRTLGQAYARSGRFDEAVRELTIAIRMQPQDAPTRRELARALFRSGNPTAAIGHYQAELEYRPDSPGIHSELADVFHSVGDEARSLEHREIAIRLQRARASETGGS